MMKLHKHKFISPKVLTAFQIWNLDIDRAISELAVRLLYIILEYFGCTRGLVDSEAARCPGSVGEKQDRIITLSPVFQH